MRVKAFGGLHPYVGILPKVGISEFTPIYRKPNYCSQNRPQTEENPIRHRIRSVDRDLGRSIPRTMEFPGLGTKNTPLWGSLIFPILSGFVTIMLFYVISFT